MKKTWVTALIVGILTTVIALINLSGGYNYISNDNYSPELNPILNIERALGSPAFREYRALGVPSDAEQADVIRSILTLIVNPILGDWFSSQGFALGLMILGAVSVAVLGYKLHSDLTGKDQIYTGVIVGLTYLSTLWIVWIFSFSMAPYVYQYGTLPLLMLAIYRLSKELDRKSIGLLVLSILLSLPVAVIPTIYLVQSIFLIIWTLWMLVLFQRGFKDIFIKGLSILGLMITVNLFWMATFGIYAVNSSDDIAGSRINRTITSSTIDLEAGKLTAENAARFYTRLLETNDLGEEKLFISSDRYSSNELFGVLSYVPIAISIFGFVLLLIGRKWNLIPLWMLLFVSWFLIKNVNTPFGGIYLWMQDNIPLFKQVLRWPSSKLSGVMMVFIALTTGISITMVVSFITSLFDKKIARGIISGVVLSLFIFLQLVYAQFLFDGELLPQRTLVQIPGEYYSLVDVLEDDNNARLLYLPEANNSYFREYSWDFVGSGFLWYMIPNPILEPALVIGDYESEQAWFEVVDSLQAQDWGTFESLANRYDLKYVLWDDSLVKGRYGSHLNLKTREYLDDQLESVWAEGGLTLYQRDLSGYEDYQEVLVSESQIGLDGIYSLEVADNPIVDPLMLSAQEIEIGDNEIVKKVIYQGEDSVVQLDITEETLDQLPITLSLLDETTVRVTPSLPFLGVQPPSLPYKDFYIGDAENLVVGLHVISRSSLQEGITVDVKYGQANLYSVAQQMDLFSYSDLLEMESGECSSAEYFPTSEKKVGQSGATLSGDNGMPCLYSGIAIPANGVAQIRIEWVADEGTMIGLCLYSVEDDACLNGDQFFITKTAVEKRNISVSGLVRNGETTLSLYVVPDDTNAEVEFKNLVVSHSPRGPLLIPIRTGNTKGSSSYALVNGSEIEAHIPVVTSQSGYVHGGRLSTWRIDSGASFGGYSVEGIDSIDHIVTKGVAKQFRDLNLVDSMYQVLFSGSTKSNIPMELCMKEVGGDKCMFTEVLDDEGESIRETYFTGQDLKVRLEIKSESFSQMTETSLTELIIHPIPAAWVSIKYTPVQGNTLEVVEATRISPSVPRYTLDLSEVEFSEGIGSIPQSSDEGWIAVYADTDISKLPWFMRVYKVFSGDIVPKRAQVDGWKQGWVVEPGRADYVYIEYAPNYLGYLGYYLLAIFLWIFTVSSLFNFINSRRK